MDLRGYWQLAQRWWWLLMLGPIMLATPTYLWAKQKPPTYQASTIIFINQSEKADAVGYNDALLNQQLAITYAQIALQPIILDEASLALGYPVTGVSALPIRQTQLLQISASGGNPVRVRDTADEVAFVFIKRQSAILPADQVATGLQVIQPALIPTHPVKSKVSLYVIGAFALGLAFAIGLAKLLTFLDNTVKSRDDLIEAADLALLGSISSFHRNVRHGNRDLLRVLPSLAIGGGSDSVASIQPAMEPYRRLCTTLDYVLSEIGSNGASGLFGTEVCETLLITSANPCESKSTIVANLAMVMARANRRVIIIDANIWRPVQHHIFEVANVNGLSNLLTSARKDPNSYVLETNTVGLRLLPAGPIPPESMPVFMAAPLEHLLAQLRDQADIILVDSPPVLAASDALELSKHVDGTILIVDASRTRAPQLRAATDELRRSGARLLGAILNERGKRGNLYGRYGLRYRESREGVATEATALTADDLPSGSDDQRFNLARFWETRDRMVRAQLSRIERKVDRNR